MSNAGKIAALTNLVRARNIKGTFESMSYARPFAPSRLGGG